MTDTATQNALFANVEDRTVRGLVLPYGEESRPSISGAEPVTFGAGTVKIPRDPSIVTLNVEHDRYAPVGRAVAIEDTPEGVVATFAIANTDEGDDVLSGIASGRLASLSAEVTNFVRRGAQAVSAALTGAALTAKGAFASAALFSVADGEITTELEAEEDGTDRALPEATEDEQAQEAPATADETPSAETREENEMADAIVPDGVQVAPEAEKEALTKDGLFSAIAYARQSGDVSQLKEITAEGTANFALGDIKISGTGALPANGVVQAAWLGELWQGNEASRVVIPSLKHADLTALEVKGFKFATKPTVATWTGNKSEIASGTATTQVVSGSLQRFAAGNDIAREFYDIPAGRPVIESYVAKLINSYAIVTDNYVMGQLVTSATAVEAETYPTGFSAAQGKIIQGALAVIDADATPSFVFVAPDVFKSLVYTPKDQVTEFLSAAMGLESGSYAGIKVLPHSGLTEGQVLVGAREAATVFELPGAPIRVNALDIAKGGVDEAVYGYVGFLAEYPEALVLVEDAAGE